VKERDAAVALLVGREGWNAGIPTRPAESRWVSVCPNSWDPARA
jgi:hypothetical protein